MRKDKLAQSGRTTDSEGPAAASGKYEENPSPAKRSAAHAAALIALFVGVPIVLVALQACGVGSFYLTSIAFIVLAIAPFFASFERKRPQARELVVLAVMCALAVAARAAFAWLPFFKPMAAIIIIAGLAFGARSGFMVGALSVLASDFIFGMGPWAPWQMFAYGLAGFVPGLMADCGVFPRSDLSAKDKARLCVFSALLVVCVVGVILDTCTLFTATTQVNATSALAVYGAGLPVNLMQAAATVVTLLLVANPLLDKLDRVCVKYGMLR